MDFVGFFFTKKVLFHQGRVGLDESVKIFSAGFNNFLYFISFIWFQPTWEVKRKIWTLTFGLFVKSVILSFYITFKHCIFIKLTLISDVKWEMLKSFAYVAHYRLWMANQKSWSQCSNLWNKDVFEINVNFQFANCIGQPYDHNICC